ASVPTAKLLACNRTVMRSAGSRRHEKLPCRDYVTDKGFCLQTESGITMKSSAESTAVSVHVLVQKSQALMRVSPAHLFFTHTCYLSDVVNEEPPRAETVADARPSTLQNR